MGVTKNSVKYDLRYVTEVHICFSPLVSQVVSKVSVDSATPVVNSSNMNVFEEANVRSHFLTSKYFPFYFESKYFGEYLYGDDSLGIAYRYSKSVVLLRSSLSPVSSKTVVSVYGRDLFTFTDFLLPSRFF